MEMRCVIVTYTHCMS